MELRVEKVLQSKRKGEVKELYHSAFLKEERMPFPLMLGMSCLWNTEFFAFYDGDTLCGLIYMATMGRLSFIMFFAVEERLRSSGYGSRILEAIQQMHPKNKLIVSIEPCDPNAANFEMRVRRKGFYQRNGYRETGYFIKLAGLEQEILINNGVFHKGWFTCFFLLYSCCTMIPPIWRVEQ